MFYCVFLYVQCCITHEYCWLFPVRVTDKYYSSCKQIKFYDSSAPSGEYSIMTSTGRILNKVCKRSMGLYVSALSLVHRLSTRSISAARARAAAKQLLAAAAAIDRPDSQTDGRSDTRPLHRRLPRTTRMWAESVSVSVLRRKGQDVRWPRYRTQHLEQPAGQRDIYPFSVNFPSAFKNISVPGLVPWHYLWWR